MFSGTVVPGNIIKFDKGKIGIEAAKAWAENPEKRPDYDKWLKENDLEAYEKEWQNKATTWGIGIGAILLLLL